MSKQSLYDNPAVFNGYKELRSKKSNANDLVEKPCLFSLLPDLQGKTVLDLGCGYGEHCMEYKNCGARSIIGIDISLIMIEEAKKANYDSAIEYINISMEDIDTLPMKFDVICSSLAIHYVKDFKSLVLKISQLLNNNGIFLFSQEHPFSTTYSDGKGERWEKSADGTKIACRLFDYCIEGERHSAWFSEDVIRYHRTFSTILCTIIECGLVIDVVAEPILSEEKMLQFPQYQDNYHRPDFLVIKAHKA